MTVHIEESGKIFQVELPFSCEEIKFADFIDFKAAEKQYFEMSKTNDLAAANRLLIKAVSMLVKAEDDFFETIPFSYDTLENFDGFIFKPDDSVTIHKMYAHLVSIMNNYEGNPCEGIEIDGVMYHLQGEATAKSILAAKLTTGESLELLELQKSFNEKLTGEMVNDSNINYSLGLREMAILYRKEGEKLPFEKTELENFIIERSKIFQNVSLNTIWDLKFFFLNFIRLLVAEKTRISSLTHPNTNPKAAKVLSMPLSKDSKVKRPGK